MLKSTKTKVLTKFSVLIAHYNNATYFKDCHQSLLNQTYQNWEAIIVDDASHEEEKIELKKIIGDDPRFILIENKVNKGVGYCKSTSIKHAKGTICGFLDPDDALTPDAIQKSVETFENNENVVATHSRMWNCNSDLKPEHISFRSKRIRNSRKLFFNVRFPVTHFFCFSKTTFEKTEGLNENLTSAVDQDLYLKLYELGNFQFIPEPLYLYRIHNKGVSQQKSKKERLYENWNLVLQNTLERRGIDVLFGKKVSKIPSLPHFIFQKRNTLFHKIVRKIT